MRDNKKIIATIKEYAESFFVALIIALFIRTFIVQAYKIPTGSMRPTLLEGDRIFVWKLPFWFGYDPQHGDVVVFKFPVDPRFDYIKRLIAMSNEQVEIRDGKVFVNNREIKDNRILNRFYYNRGDFGAAGQQITVPGRSLYVLGDNSANSRDSRYWGFVPRSNLVGRAIVVYWPLSRMRLIH